MNLNPLDHKSDSNNDLYVSVDINLLHPNTEYHIIDKEDVHDVTCHQDHQFYDGEKVLYEYNIYARGIECANVQHISHIRTTHVSYVNDCPNLLVKQTLFLVFYIFYMSEEVMC